MVLMDAKCSPHMGSEAGRTSWDSMKSRWGSKSKGDGLRKSLILVPFIQTAQFL